MEREKEPFHHLKTSNCFLCVKPCQNKNKDKETRLKTFSLKNIFYYLKINLSQLKSSCSIDFNQDVQVELCKDCGAIMERFSKQFRTLEVCRIQIEEILVEMEGKLLGTENPEELTADQSKPFEASQVLRRTLLEKCYQKLLNSYPKLILWKTPHNESKNEDTSSFSETLSKLPLELSPKITKRKRKTSTIEVVHNEREKGDRMKRKCSGVGESLTATLQELKSELEPLNQESTSQSQPIITKNDLQPNLTTFACEPPISPSPVSPSTSSMEPDEMKNIFDKSLSRRRLRSIHKCNSCMKTFSNLESLSAHLSECKSETVIEASSDDEQFEDALVDEYFVEGNSKMSENENSEGENYEAVPSDPLEPSSEEETENKEDQPEMKPDFPDEKNKNKPLQCQRYRYKCPGEDCTEIFPQLHSLLQHWKESHENKTECNVENKLKIEIVSFFAQSSKENPPEILSKFAKIRIPYPKELFLCKIGKCRRAFYSQEDFEAHEKLHGSFTCARCPVTKDFLPELSTHEVHGHTISDSVKGYYNCQRCDLSFKHVQNYLRHHSSVHFKLKFAEQSCPVCKTFVVVYEQKFSALHLFRHIKRHHGLLKTNKVFHCHEAECSAYFISSRGLAYHLKVDHGIQEEMIRRSSIPEPPQPPNELSEKRKAERVRSRKRIARVKKETARTKVKLRLGKRMSKKKKEVNPNNRIQCPLCPKSFSKGHKLRLKRHMSKIHSQTDMKAWFGSEQNLNFHYRLNCPGENSTKLFLEVHELHLHYKEAHNVTQKSKLTVKISSFKVNPDTKLFETLSPEVKKSQGHGSIEVSPLEKDETIFVCEKEACKRPVYSKEDLERHVKLHGKFTCGKCPKTKTFLPDLAIHELKVHGGMEGKNRILKCQRCEENFSDVPNYLKHFTTAHYSLNFKEESCPLCRTYLFQWEKTFEKSQKWYSVLFKHFTNSHNLEIVGDGTHKVGGRRCEEPNCSVYFSTLGSINKHRRMVHGLDESRMEDFIVARQSRVCEQCGKMFMDGEHLRLHSLSHLGPEAWEFCCEVCSKKCITKQKLEEHMRVHTKEKPFVCEVCGAKYAHRHNLRIHVNSKHGDVMQDVSRKYVKGNLKIKKQVSKKRKKKVVKLKKDEV